jgi:RHS repeat-associated protein
LGLTTKKTPLLDDFNDGNYTGWSVSGTWSAANGYMENTVNPSTFVFFSRSRTDSDGIIRFRYSLEDTSNNNYYLRVLLRQTSAVRVDVRFYPDRASLQEYDGTQWNALDSDTGVTSSQGTWYEVVAKVEGSNVQIWRAAPGGSMDLALDTENATVTATDTVMFYVPAGAQVRVDDVGIEDASHTTTSTLAYNAANELTSMTDGSATIYFTYDPWGRMVSKYQAQTYSASYAYRYDDKLYTVTSSFPGEGTVTYQYGGPLALRSRTQGANEKWYNPDAAGNVVSEEDSAGGSGNLTTTYVGSDPMIQAPPELGDVAGSNPATGTWRYYLKDYVASTRRLHAQDKSTLATYEFDPYGAAYFHTGSTASHLFTGKEWDAVSQLQYSLYRHYSSSTARWLTRDAYGAEAWPNVYEYVYGDPVNWVDDVGLAGAPAGEKTLSRMDARKLGCKLRIEHIIKHLRQQNENNPYCLFPDETIRVHIGGLPSLPFKKGDEGGYHCSLHRGSVSFRFSLCEDLERQRMMPTDDDQYLILHEIGHAARRFSRLWYILSRKTKKIEEDAAKNFSGSCELYDFPDP